MCCADAFPKLGNAARQFIEGGFLIAGNIGGKSDKARLQRIKALVNAQFELFYTRFQFAESCVVQPFIFAKQQFANLIHFVIFKVATWQAALELAMGGYVHGFIFTHNRSQGS